MAERIDALYENMVNTLVEPMLRDVALPAFDKWRNGSIKKLSDIDPVLQKNIESWLHTDKAQELLIKPVAEWLKPVAYEIEEHTMPICVRHNIPYRSMSLTSYMSLSDINVKIDAKNVFEVEAITWLINAIISVIIGLICGGSGVALISGGISGIVAGTVVSLLILLLGKKQMQKLLMDMNIPVPLRKMTSASYLESRIEKLSSQVKANFYENLENEKNEEISARMVSQISEQIEQFLTKMAEIVEIPLD